MREAIETSDAKAFVKGYQPLLSVDEERALFAAWHGTNPQGYADFMDPSNEDVDKFFGGDDNTYLTRIILAYGPVIRRSIKELSGYKMPEEEMLSEGLVALVEAARRYIPKRGRFATYAKTWCKGVMWGYITKNFFLLHVCTNHTKKRLFFALRKLIATELVKHGTFKLTPDKARELAAEFKCSEHEVTQINDMFQRPYESISEPVPGLEASDLTREDTIIGGEDAMVLVMDADIVTFQKRLVHDAMKSVLTDREKRIFTVQKLAEEKEDSITLEALAREYGCSKERVRQLRNAAEKKVTKEIRRVVGIANIDSEDLFYAP